VSCPSCDGSARFVGFRGKATVSLVGSIRIERAYYHCRSCHQGFCPWDAVLDLTAADVSPGAREVVSMAGAVDSFGQAAVALLTRMAGLRLSESTVQRTAEAVGADVGRRLADGETFGAAAAWDWHKDADGKTCAYVAIDATGTPQQGPGAASAEGRMCTVAMVYNPIPEQRERWAKPSARRRPAWQARYVATLTGQAALGEPLRRQAAQAGMDAAERWIALSDGGGGLEDWFRANFGRVDAVILDFFHVSEHLADLAKAWHGAETELAQAQHQKWVHRLKHEGGAAVLEELRGLELPNRDSLRELWRSTTGHFENHVHRMDYPSYLAHGWQIGSGPIEAACKTVIGRRLKGTGMRWSPDGADAMSHLRALFVSEPGQWAAYWNSRRRAA
jgi:hypothetical protein